MDLYYAGLDVLRMSLLFVGSVVIFIGVVRAALGALRAGPGSRAPQRIIDGMALGLEFFIGAGLLNLILNPTWTAVQVAALTIVTRKLITISLNRLARGS
ncbi:MAG: DUF1622 domain-containing protein [Actinobacteria bacterium]|nr:DUF1622 domain-containing protein [Actinomycetota bacterium]